MKQSDVRERLEKFLYYLRQEQELRDQIAALQFYGSEKDVAGAMKQETEIMKEVEKLRQEKMLPLISEVAAFVSTKQAELLKSAGIKPGSTPQKKGAEPARKPAATKAR